MCSQSQTIVFFLSFTKLIGGLHSTMNSLSVINKELKEGSVIAITEILTLDESATSDLEKLTVIGETLKKLAISSNGFLDPLSITIESSGWCLTLIEFILNDKVKQIFLHLRYM